MGFNIQFNAKTVEPNLPLAALPTGEYDVIIVSTDEKPVKNGGGSTFYEIVMQVIGPPEFKGRRVVDRLNCKNQNEQAREIAYATLSSICYVTGVIQLQSSSAELHGKPFRVAVAKVPRDDDPTKDGNDIRGYFDLNGNDAGAIKKAYEGGGSVGGSSSSGFGSDETSSGNSGFGTDSNAGGADTGASFGVDTGSNDQGSGDDEVPPRIIELMVEKDLEYEAAVAAYESELAAAKAPKETPAQAAARKAAEAAKAKAAAAAKASTAGAGTGVPDWAQG